ncbi:MAG: glycosyl hydrolase, partial [Planctomycetota bacterium]
MRFDLTRSLCRATAVAALAAAGTAHADDHESEAPDFGDLLGAMPARSIGPSVVSGRISDLAVNPHNPSEYYAAVASGGLWKTTDNGTTWTPVFDRQSVYSIGCVVIDPSDTNVVWVGTGENNSQRSTAWGDGVYKSIDGGRTWKHVGLKDSQKIGMITIDPRDSDVVYVASQGPLWNSGGERGLYKTTDGGETWEKILEISEHTGVNEVHIDPEDPDTLYAAAYQRQRKVWTLINGGPESGVYKSTDGGANWRKINRGLPGGDKGKIGLEVSPADPNRLWAIVEASSGQGTFRSDNKGESWSRVSGYMSSSPQYYNELVAHPHDPDIVFSLDTLLRMSTDGGRTFPSVHDRSVHVDYHALWINPNDTDHWIAGNDGGVYDTFDGGGAWRFIHNMPITQFYKVAIDNAEPFYNVYGGTQDNNTFGGPIRTIYNGIQNEDWYNMVGGDGFEPAIDPTDPNIVYAQWQYGNLVRHDRRSGEITDIKPRERPGDEPYVFNWDSPLFISPHSHTRIYFGGRQLYRSDDRGNSWTPVSGDLTRGLDRNQLAVMDKIQRPEAVAKHNSTSIYGNTVAADESPLKEGLIMVGTDDGLIHVTRDGGEAWTTFMTEDIGAPKLGYVAGVTTSRHDEDEMFAVINNHKEGDFAPYIFHTADGGETWTNIAGDLPENDAVWAVRQDHEDPDLLFCGTEFGAYASSDAGEHWHKIRGIPTISVRDLEIQRDWNDVVFATFGRSFYVLDDYAPLRDHDDLDAGGEAVLFDVRPAPLFVPASKGRGSQGNSFYRADNPDYGAMITYAMSEGLTTLREDRRKAERDGDAPYPTMDEFRAEDNERAPQVFLTIRHPDHGVLRRIPVGRGKGVRRVAWDLTMSPMNPVTSASGGGFGGIRVAPGEFSVTLDVEDEGELRRLAGP